MGLSCNMCYFVLKPDSFFPSKMQYCSKIFFILSIAGSFELSIDPGQFTDSEIIVMLGENGTGKTTFIKMLAGRLAPDGGGMWHNHFFPTFNILNLKISWLKGIALKSSADIYTIAMVIEFEWIQIYSEFTLIFLEVSEEKLRGHHGWETAGCSRHAGQSNFPRIVCRPNRLA